MGWFLKSPGQESKTKHRFSSFSYLLVQPLFKVFSLDVLKNSNTLPEAVTENQAITENQCYFYCKSLMIGKNRVETIQKRGGGIGGAACLGTNTSFPCEKGNQ